MQQKDSPAIFLLEDIEVHAGAALLARLHVKIPYIKSKKSGHNMIIHAPPLVSICFNAIRWKKYLRFRSSVGDP
jgi:hypothetical protein